MNGNSRRTHADISRVSRVFSRPRSLVVDKLIFFFFRVVERHVRGNDWNVQKRANSHLIDFFRNRSSKVLTVEFPSFVTLCFPRGFLENCHTFSEQLIKQNVKNNRKIIKKECSGL